METKEWTYVDRSKWPEEFIKLYASEPDKRQWIDVETGLPCLIVRGGGGALCGYVGISKSHPYFEKSYNDVDVDVHGGLTFSEHCMPHKDNPERGICHIVEDGDDDNIWWLGFDCGHSGDIHPGYKHHYSGGYGYSSYKDIGYVAHEVKKLAKQLKETA